MKAILPAHSLSGYRTGKSFNEDFRFSRWTNLKAVGNYVNKDARENPLISTTLEQWESWDIRKHMPSSSLHKQL